jgi:hypothetical protein
MLIVISSLQKRFPESVPPSAVSHENPWIGSLERASCVAGRNSLGVSLLVTRLVTVDGNTGAAGAWVFSDLKRLVPPGVGVGKVWSQDYGVNDLERELSNLLEE